MAAKKVAVPSYIEQYMQAYENLCIAMPLLMRASNDEGNPMTGLVIFRGDNNDWVVGLRRVAEDGEPQVLWSSGQDLTGMFTTLEGALRSGKFRTDRKEVARLAALARGGAKK